MTLTEILEQLKSIDTDNFCNKEQIKAIQEALGILAHLKGFENFKSQFNPLRIKEFKQFINTCGNVDAYLVVTKDDGFGHPINNTLNPVWDMSMGYNEVTHESFIRLWI